MEGGPRLALVARLTEAVRWDSVVQRHEHDPWSYLRRKLLETEPPLRDFKAQMLAEASGRLLEDLAKPAVPAEAKAAHREAFEPLLTSADFADLSFHLDQNLDPGSRIQGIQNLLPNAKIITLFDIEALPPARRPRDWETNVTAMAKRLQVDLITRIIEMKEWEGERRRRYLAGRLRRNLSEFLSVARGAGGPVIRDEITPFMLGRLEASIAACLRLFNRWR